MKLCVFLIAKLLKAKEHNFNILTLVKEVLYASLYTLKQEFIKSYVFQVKLVAIYSSSKIDLFFQMLHTPVHKREIETMLEMCRASLLRSYAKAIVKRLRL